MPLADVLGKKNIWTSNSSSSPVAGTMQRRFDAGWRRHEEELLKALKDLTYKFSFKILETTCGRSCRTAENAACEFGHRHDVLTDCNRKLT